MTIDGLTRAIVNINQQITQDQPDPSSTLIMIATRFVNLENNYNEYHYQDDG